MIAQEEDKKINLFVLENPPGPKVLPDGHKARALEAMFL